MCFLSAGFKDVLKVANVTTLKAMTPIFAQHLVLAAESGLYVYHVYTRVVTIIDEGLYTNVHANQTYIVSNKAHPHKIILRHVKPPYNIRREMEMLNSNQEPTKLNFVYIAGELIYFSNWNNGDYTVQVYNTRGQHVKQYGQTTIIANSTNYNDGSESLSVPIVCGSSADRGLLVADVRSDRIEVMLARKRAERRNELGQWFITGVLNVVLFTEKLYVIV